MGIIFWPRHHPSSTRVIWDYKWKSFNCKGIHCSVVLCIMDGIYSSLHIVWIWENQVCREIMYISFSLLVEWTLEITKQQPANDWECGGMQGHCKMWASPFGEYKHKLLWIYETEHPNGIMFCPWIRYCCGDRSILGRFCYPNAMSIGKQEGSEPGSCFAKLPPAWSVCIPATKQHGRESCGIRLKSGLCMLNRRDGSNVGSKSTCCIQCFKYSIKLITRK